MSGNDRRPIAARRTRPAEAAAGWLIRRGASADAISIAGMLAALAAGLCLAGVWLAPGAARPLWLAAALLMQLRLAANLLDGMVAIGRGIASPRGELFNEVPDRVSDTAILVGLGLAAGGEWGLGLGAALAAMATAYVRAVGRAAGAPSDFRGPMAKQHRMALVTVLAVACALAPAGWTAALPRWTLIAIIILATLTAARRLAGAARALGPR
jgi:phosphatidylglycerophosphate synthase